MRSDERTGSSCKRLELNRLNRRGFTFYSTLVQEWDQFFWKPQNERNGQPGNLYHLTKGPLWPKKILLSIHPRNFGTHVTVRLYVRTDAEGGGRESGARPSGEGGGVCYSWALACAKRVQRAKHPRNFGYEDDRPYVRTYATLSYKPGEILHFKYPRVLAVNRIATRTLKDNKNNNNKAEELEQEITSKGGQFCCLRIL